MDRRKFLAGSIAVGAGAASLAANTNAGIVESNSHLITATKSPTKNQSARFRLTYPVSAEEKASGKVIYDKTYPVSDIRRYRSTATPDNSFDSSDYFKYV